MKRTASMGLLLSVCLLVGGSSFEARGQAGDADGVRVMRMAMSVQANKPYGKNGYASISEVMTSIHLDTATVMDADTIQVGAYTLRVSRSDDRKHFQMALTPVSGCGTAWFGSEANVIYTGKALGCQ